MPYQTKSPWNIFVIVFISRLDNELSACWREPVSSSLTIQEASIRVMP